MKWTSERRIFEMEKAGAHSAVPGRVELIQIRRDGRYALVLDSTEPAAAEYFGILRSRLSSVNANHGLQTFLITSADKGEGKSLVCLNLGLSFGQAGRKRVLLVDGDLRLATLSHTLQGKRTMGLSDFLRSDMSLEAIVRPTSLSSLFFVTAGELPQRPLPELLEGPRWAEFLALAKQHYDLVIVDSLPAATPVADFELMLAPCDALLVVVRLRKTDRESLGRVLRRVDRKKLLGVIINNADQPYRHSYYDYQRATKPR